MPGGACGQFEFEFGFEFNCVPVFAPKTAGCAEHVEVLGLSQ